MRKLRIVVIFLVMMSLVSIDSYTYSEELIFDAGELFFNHGSIMMIIDPETGNIVFANKAASEFYQLSEMELEKMNIKEINTLTSEEIDQEMTLAKEEARNYFRFKHRLADGTIKDVEVYSYPTDISGKMMLFSIVIDITEKVEVEHLRMDHERHVKENMMAAIYGLIIFIMVVALLTLILLRKNRELSYLNKFDPLTGVLNRTAIRVRYQKYIDKMKEPWGFFMIDVNNLKFINDTFGHIAGDQMIIAVSDRLKAFRSGDCCIARVSGDEFVMMIPECNPERLKEIEREISDYKFEINSIEFDVSVGGFLICDKEVTYDQAFKESESNMYTAKAHSKEVRNRDIENQLLEKIYAKNDLMKVQSQCIPLIATCIAKQLAMSEDEVYCIKEAARLQGVGHAIDIERYVSKSQISSEDEMIMFKKHPEKGYNILNALGRNQCISNGVFYHHEKVDGSGFPKGLMGEEIPLASRIIMIANTIFSERHLQEEKSFDVVWEAVRRNRNIALDSELLDRIDKEYLKKEISEILKGCPY